LVSFKEDVADRSYRVTRPSAPASCDGVHAHIDVESPDVHSAEPALKPLLRNPRNGPDTLSYSPGIVRFQKDSYPIAWFVHHAKESDGRLAVDFDVPRHLRTGHGAGRRTACLMNA